MDEIIIPRCNFCGNNVEYFNNMFICNYCGDEVSNPIFDLKASFILEDDKGSIEINVRDKVVELLFGMSAQEIISFVSDEKNALTYHVDLAKRVKGKIVKILGNSEYNYTTDSFKINAIDVEYISKGV